MNNFPKVIFICRSGLLGDTLVSIPSLTAIREAFPQTHLIYVGEHVPGSKYISPQDVLGGTGLVDAFLYFNSGGFRWTGLKSLLLLAWETIRLRPALVIILEAPGRYTRKTRFFRWLGCTVVPAGKGFFSSTRQPEKPSQVLVAPISEQLLEAIAQLTGRTPNSTAPSAQLPLRADSALGVREWIEFNGANGKRLLGLGIWSNMPSKRWPLNRYQELVQRLRVLDSQIFPVVLGAREERPHGLELVKDWGTGAVAAGEFTIHQRAHLLAQCALYIGNDTGTMHLAAAVGTSCVAIFSARDQPGKWHPYGSTHVVLRKSPPCAGCLLRECNQYHLRCLSEISVDEVFTACVRLLSLPPA